MESEIHQNDPKIKEAAKNYVIIFVVLIALFVIAVVVGFFFFAKSIGPL